MATVTAEGMPPASIVGRIGKLLVGLFQIQGVVSIIAHFSGLREGTWNTGLWIFVALAFYAVQGDNCVTNFQRSRIQNDRNTG